MVKHRRIADELFECVWPFLRGLAPKRLTPDFQKQSSRGCLYSSSPLEVFLGKGALKTCSKSTGKHPYRSLSCPFLNKKKSALILQKSTLILGKSARNAYRSEHIPRNLPCPEIFLVARLKRCSACNSIKKETSTQVFSCEFREIFKKAFFKEHLWWLLLDFIVQINFRTYSVSASFIFYSQAIYFDFFSFKKRTKITFTWKQVIFAFLNFFLSEIDKNIRTIGPKNGTQYLHSALKHWKLTIHVKNSLTNLQETFVFEINK